MGDVVRESTCSHVFRFLSGRVEAQPVNSDQGKCVPRDVLGLALRSRSAMVSLGFIQGQLHLTDSSVHRLLLHCQ